ncbi:hypothetical protein ACJIZ3_001865 [Penstemon smallii]|uniref:Uncharacterized protein n=1 Tax=Penstemon smallii TaxID=265156 RepID=A0ABD3U801_9LAMI
MISSSQSPTLSESFEWAKMGATTTTTTTFFHLSVPVPPPQTHKLSLLPKNLTNYRCSISSPSPFIISKVLIPRSVSSPETSVVEEEQENQTPSLDSGSLPLSGCKACGREEIENGCNGEGRIQGGIATFPGFGWWPIKAYRPCPAFVASGGRYRRTGQSMDEVVSGSGGRKTSNETTSTNGSKKKDGARRLKR